MAVAVVGLLLLVANQSQRAAAESTQACSSEDVMLLIDQSRSLSGSDPARVRRIAAETLIDTLSQSSVPVQLTLAGFADEVTAPKTFSLPEGTDAARLELSALVDQFDGDNTDYILALGAAVDHFKSVPGRERECRRLVWFTDGAYDIDNARAPSLARYTKLTNDKEIESQFLGHVCGPLPSDTNLTENLSASIKDAQFDTKLIDLRVGRLTATQQARRDATSLVLGRLFSDGDDVCRINGSESRIPVQNTDALVKTFFDQGQQGTGRLPLDDCGALTVGMPISLVKSLAVQATPYTGTVTIAGPTGQITSGTPAAVAGLEPGQRSSAGNIVVQVQDGEVATCFLDAEIAVSNAGADKVWADATGVTLAVKVTGGDPSEYGAAPSLGENLVEVSVAVDGDATQLAAWNPATDRWELNYRRPRDGRFGDGSMLAFEATATFKPTKVTSSGRWDVAVVAAPPPPTAGWVGPRLREGAGTIAGKVVVSPGFVAAGTMCVELPRTTPIRSGFDQLGTLTISGGGAERCKTVSGPIEFDATVEFTKSQNRKGQVEFIFAATYQDQDSQLGERKDLAAGEFRVDGFEVIKQGDGGTGVLFAVALSVTVLLLSYIVLFVTARRQGRLPNPTRFVYASADIVASDAPRGRSVEASGEFSVSEMHAPRGDRSKFTFGPVTARQVWPWNPLAELHAIVEADDGVVLSPQGRSSTRLSRRIATPNQPPQLVVAHIIDGIGKLYVLLRAGSTGETYRDVARSALMKMEGPVLAALDGPKPVRGAEQAGSVPGGSGVIAPAVGLSTAVPSAGRSAMPSGPPATTAKRPSGPPPASAPGSQTRPDFTPPAPPSKK